MTCTPKNVKKCTDCRRNCQIRLLPIFHHLLPSFSFMFFLLHSLLCIQSVYVYTEASWNHCVLQFCTSSLPFPSCFLLHSLLCIQSVYVYIEASWNHCVLVLCRCKHVSKMKSMNKLVLVLNCKR